MDLYNAAESGNLWRVRALVEKGVDLELCNSEGRTAIFVASQNGHLEVVRYLLEQQAAKKKYLLEQQAAKKKDWTPFKIVSWFLCLVFLFPFLIVCCFVYAFVGSWCGFLTAFADMLTSLAVYATTIFDFQLKFLLGLLSIICVKLFDMSTWGVSGDMEKADSYGWTPLMIASANGRLDVVRYLLEQGANRDKTSYTGKTSLHKAVQYGRLEVAKLLMVYGADLNARDKDNRTPISYARTEEMKQAILNEPRRRMDEAPGKRATEQDQQPDAADSASAQLECNKHSGEGVEGEVADEDQDSEPSSDEDDD